MGEVSEHAPYFIPPSDYAAPSGCGECGRPIIFAPVVGGHRWVHLTRPVTEHDVVMTVPWWDTSTGRYVEGNPVVTTHSWSAPSDANTDAQSRPLGAFQSETPQ